MPVSSEGVDGDVALNVTRWFLFLVTQVFYTVFPFVSFQFIEDSLGISLNSHYKSTVLNDF